MTLRLLAVAAAAASLLAACDDAATTQGSSSGAGGQDATTTSASATASTSGSTGAGAVPLIGDVLTCGVADPVGGMAKGTDLQRHDIDLAAFPDALCNDGTGAVIYYRPYSGAANRNRWVVELVGGGSCGTAQECADRWCGVGTAFSMTQMTSNVAPAGGTVGNGIFERRVDNPIGDFNHVLVRYCSSDVHAGTSRDVIVDANVPGTSQPTQFRMHFLGAKILDATLATLRGDGVPLLDYTIDGGSTALPDLDDAQLLVLAGASAGGVGTTFQIDRALTALRATNPGLVGVAVVDSAFAPDLSLLGYEHTAACLQRGACDYESSTTAAANAQIYDTVTDDTCVAWHMQHDPPGLFACSDPGHVLRNHVTTPMVVRQGQRDSLISAMIIEAGFGASPGAAVMNLDEYANLVRGQLTALGGLPTSAEEGVDVARAPALYGPTCDKHETLRNTPATFDVTIAGTHFFEVVANWVAGATPDAAITPEGGVETCAQ